VKDRLFAPAVTEAAEQVQKPQGFSSNEKFEVLPPPTGSYPYRLALQTILGKTPERTDALGMFVIGDSGGIMDPNPQMNVAAALAAEQAKSAAHLVYHVGDVVYFDGDHADYFPQFYEPYEGVALPIVAIPGNHDGDNSNNTSVRSLDGFVTNFCAPEPVLTLDAKDAVRDAMDQPNVYWTLTAKLATVIGCYTNVPSGGQVAADQAAWLAAELAAAPQGVALIVAMHHPPYSADAHHGGSARMGSLLDAATKQAGRKPDLVLSGHVHNYQRFTRTDGVAYIVVGNSGYHNLHSMAPGSKVGAKLQDVKLEGFIDKAFGFLRLTIDSTHISGVFTQVPRHPTGASHVATADTFDLLIGTAK
jgi:hypothetical protein